LIIASGTLRQLAQPDSHLAGNSPPTNARISAKPPVTQKIAHGDAIATFWFGGFMFRLKLIVPAVILAGGFLMVCSTASFGKQEYTKQTKKACTYCHVDAAKNPKDLKDAGKYFQEHKNLDGYQEKK
jgi:hypothetical protein